MSASKIVIATPSVRLLAQPQFIPHPDYRLVAEDIDDASDGAKLAEFAGRLCYMSFESGRKTNKEYLEHILEVGHGSVLEHAHYSVLIEGVSRSCTHEIVRHRHFNYSQLSQRYVDAADTAFVMPPELAELPGDGPEHGVFFTQCAVALTGYAALTSMLETRLLAGRDPKELERDEWVALRKRVRQAARAVLPNCTETKLVMTGNVRTLHNWFTLRGNVAADREIRRLAVLLLQVVQPIARPMFDHFTVTEDGQVVGKYPKP